ncbi:hypothetical protein [Weissella hellenica]|uniref:hypothetical protein n=1 Tax=Weissella hellenica TaxID=46256 RepID=UPI00388464E3
MLHQLRLFKWRCRYYFGYIWSFIISIAASFAAVTAFNQGQLDAVFALLVGGYLVSISFFVASLQAQRHYHKTRDEFAGLYAKLKQLEAR